MEQVRGARWGQIVELRRESHKRFISEILRMINALNLASATICKDSA